jgi:hypothetical protein
MKLNTLTVILVVVFLAVGFTPTHTSSASRSSVANVQTSEVKSKADVAKNSTYEGYTIDGYATASQLAAQRSHTPAGEDERNFAVFTGLVVILIVMMVSQVISKRG